MRYDFVRIGLIREQVNDPDLNIERLSIAVKPSDSRAARYTAQYGNRCWERSVCPAATIGEAINVAIKSWLDVKLWKRRAAEIKRSRALL